MSRELRPFPRDLGPVATGELFGRDGMFIESMGALHTDIYNLSTATAIYVSPVDRMLYPAMYSAHPVWNFLNMEKRTVQIEYGFVRAMCEYAGFEGAIVPTIEYSSGVNEEPIQTHPDFADFAGSPSDPLNGSKWVDEQGVPSTDDAKGIFEKFWSNPPNIWAGQTSYLVPVVIKRITTIEPGPINVDGLVGHLSSGMLCTNASSTKRGIVYQNVVEYRGAGPRGWNPALYG